MNCCYFSVTLVSELSLLQQVRTICLSSFSGKFLLHPKNQSVKSHRSLPSIRSHSEFHHALVFCPENRDYMSRWRKTNTRSILKSLDTTHSIYRFYASRVTQILQGEREKKPLSHCYSTCIYWVHRRVQRKQTEGFFGIQFTAAALGREEQ